MKRTDSAFGEPLRPEPAGKDPATIYRSNTIPTRRRKSNETLTDSPNPISTSNFTQRPASEKRSITHRKPTEPRRKSVTSSSDNSTKSRRRGHGSLPSSRRTSFTIVDPSRPTRQYRINSSQTCPTMNRDIDDVLALHFRSCSLFQNPMYRSNLPGSTISGCGPADTDFGSTRANQTTAPHQSTDGIEPLSPKESEETVVAPEMADTPMHWMSPSTRKLQYEKIDRVNGGIRGFMRRVLPKCVSGPPPPRFYEKDRSDVGSVRRYRMDMSDDEGDEKSTSALRLQNRKIERSRPEKQSAKTNKWGCF